MFHLRNAIGLTVAVAAASFVTLPAPLSTLKSF